LQPAQRLTAQDQPAITGLKQRPRACSSTRRPAPDLHHTSSRTKRFTVEWTSSVTSDRLRRGSPGIGTPGLGKNSEWLM